MREHLCHHTANPQNKSALVSTIEIVACGKEPHTWKTHTSLHNNRAEKTEQMKRE